MVDRGALEPPVLARVQVGVNYGEEPVTDYGLIDTAQELGKGQISDIVLTLW